jgi:putative ABC transport system substrate-binding protein
MSGTIARRQFVAAVGMGAASVLLPRVVRAQNRPAMPVIGVLMPGHQGVASPADNFFVGMRELGYENGRNVVYQIRWGAGSDRTLPQLAAELVALEPAVIVVSGTRAIDAVRRATATIPVVVPFTGEMVWRGFAASLAHPGGNVTGLSAMTADVSAKRLELMKEALPKLTRVALLWNSAPGRDMRWSVVEATARALAVELTAVELRDLAAAADAFAAMQPTRGEAAYVINDRFISDHRAPLIELAAKHRVATMFDYREYTAIGGLMSYGPSIAAMHRRGAVFVDKILRGAKPADLPIEQPTRFELVINLKTAIALGVEIPATLLARADEVIE